jgi:hypothetical protein
MDERNTSLEFVYLLTLPTFQPSDFGLWFFFFRIGILALLGCFNHDLGNPRHFIPCISSSSNSIDSLNLHSFLCLGSSLHYSFLRNSSSTSSKNLDANNLQGLSGNPLSRERELMVVRPGSAGEDVAGIIMKVWLGAEQKVNTLSQG